VPCNTGSCNRELPGQQGVTLYLKHMGIVNARPPAQQQSADVDCKFACRKRCHMVRSTYCFCQLNTHQTQKHRWSLAAAYAGALPLLHSSAQSSTSPAHLRPMLDYGQWQQLCGPTFKCCSQQISNACKFILLITALHAAHTCTQCSHPHLW
jgi:hypothetical protein